MTTAPVALVTGSTRGIGRATALELARRGYDIVVHYRREAELAQSAAKEIENLGRRALVVQGDLSDVEVPARIGAAVGETFGHLDVLVANAAASAFKPLMELEARHLDLTFRTVVHSFFLLSQQAVPLMEGRAGTIIAISGIDTMRVIHNHGLLGAAKSAQEQLVRYLAVELAPHDIAVNALLPGYVDTDSYRIYGETSYPGGVEPMKAAAEAATPAGRVATPGEMAEIIAFLCTPAGRWLRGQVIVADGGITLPWI